MIHIYTQVQEGKQWVDKYRDASPLFACVLGFTETGLIPGISAAGSTPDSRKYTACADAEFLYYGTVKKPVYPLPPLVAGASPVLISRAVVEGVNMPVYLFDAGLPQTPPIPVINLGGAPAKCLSHGAAMSMDTVKGLFRQGLMWGERLAQQASGYLILSECVVGGTTTALGVLTALGVNAAGKVNSSHPVCNHEQKWAVVQTGLENMRAEQFLDPLKIVAAVGDPMQVAVAAMALAASRYCGVLLGGGTQMLAVYALIRAIAHHYNLFWQPEAVVVGTTRWVTEDPTGATVDLALSLGEIVPCLIATQLSFIDSQYPQLQAYEQGFVKEGVGAGAACIAAEISHGWQQKQLLTAIESQLHRLVSLELI